MYEVKVITAWKAARKRSCEIAPHKHGYHELVFYSSCSGSGFINGMSYSFSPGDYIFIPKDTLHSEKHLSDGELACIGFICDEAAFPKCLICGNPITEKTVYEILNEVTVQDSRYREMLEIKLNELFILSSRDSGRNKTIPPRDFCFAAAYIESSYREKIVLSNLAKMMDLSYDYFRHAFADQIGCSPQRYLMEIRLREANKLVSGTGLSCTEIAEKCGFSDSSQFSMMFRKKFKISPTELRKKLDLSVD